MTDMEKVIKELKRCVLVTTKEYGKQEYVEIPYELYKNALALLKEQEHKDKMFHALEEDWKRLRALLKEQENARKRNPVIVCPHCGKRVK